MDACTKLLEELRQYQPADSLERQHRQALLDLLSYGTAPLSRHSFVPGHVTASCFILATGPPRVLLHHHRRLGRWLQMGGHVEPGESVVEAALREGREESGLSDLTLLSDGFIDLDVHDIPAGRGEPDHAHFDVRYAALAEHPEAILLDRAESTDLAWADLEQAISLMNEEASKRAILKIKRMLR